MLVARVAVDGIAAEGEQASDSESNTGLRPSVRARGGRADGAMLIGQGYLQGHSGHMVML